MIHRGQKRREPRAAGFACDDRRVARHGTGQAPHRVERVGVIDRNACVDATLEDFPGQFRNLAACKACHDRFKRAVHGHALALFDTAVDAIREIGFDDDETRAILAPVHPEAGADGGGHGAHARLDDDMGRRPRSL